MNRLPLWIGCLTLLFALKAEAAQLPDNGDFESGVLMPWVSDDDSVRRAEIVAARDCYRGHDTRRAAPRGRFAAQLVPRASLQSARFDAGEAIGFIALQAVSTASDKVNSREALQVELLDADSDAVLARQLLSPAMLLAGATCGSADTDQGDTEQLSSHYVSTRAFTGRPIRVRFQNVADSQQSLFILLDQLVIFSPGEHTLFQSRPHAQAGFYFHSNGGTALSSEGSIDPDNQPLPLRYGWYLDGKEYLAANPCLDGLPAGNYRAVLYVNDGHHAVSDALRLWIPQTYPDSNQITRFSCDPVSAQTLNPVAPDRAQEVAPPTPVKAPAGQRDQPAGKTGLSDPIPEAEGITASQEPPVSPPRLRSPTPVAPDTPLVRKAYSLKNSGIRWLIEADRRASIITPAHFPEQPVTLLSPEGEELDRAVISQKTQQGIRYRFAGSSEEYPLYAIVRVGHTDYLVMSR